MGEKARLRRDVIVAQQQRDRAIVERDQAVNRARRLEAELSAAKAHAGHLRWLADWWADLARAVGR